MLSIQNRGGLRARRTAMILAAGAAMSVAGLSSAFAQSTWINPAGGNFNAGANWQGGVAPVSVDPTLQLVFTGSGTAPTATNNIGTPFQFSTLTFNTNYATSFTISSSLAADLFDLFNAATITVSGNGNNVLSATGGNLRLNANGTINGTGLGNLTLNGVISEAGGARSLTVSGTPATQNSRVVVFGAANTFSGGLTLDGGTVRTNTTNAGVFGTGNITVTSNGGVIQVANAFASLSVPTIQLNGTLRWLGTTGSTLTTTTLAGAGSLVINNTATTTIQSNSTGYTGTVTMDRSDLANLSGTPGTLTLSGASGALTNVPTFNVRAGGVLNLSNSSAATTNTNRIGDSAAINLASGTLTINSNTTAINEVVGAITGAGYSTIGATSSAGSVPAQISAASLSRSDRGTFLIRGSSLGSGVAITGANGYVTLTAAPTLSGGGGASGTTNMSIVPWAIGDTSGSGTGTGLLTYFGTTGFRPLAAAEYAATLTGTDNNIGLTAATANNASVTLNALRLSTSGAVSGTGTLNITSGAILNTNSSATITNTVAFGAAEGYVFSPSALGISGALTGSNGLTKSGTGVLTLSGNNTGLTGQLTVNSGIISYNAGSALPGTGQIVINSGQAGGTTTGAGLRYTGATALNITRDIAINTGWASINSSSALGPVTLSGVISGPGGLYVDSTGEIALTGNNTFTGPIRVNNGNIRISSDANLGNGGNFDFGNGSAMGLILDGDWTTSRHINSSLTSGTLTMNTQGFNATWNGPVTNNSSGGFATSSDSIRKAGTGRLQLNAPGTMGAYGWIINANGGEIRLAQNASLLSTTYTVNTNGLLSMDNTAVPTGTPSGSVTIDRMNDSATVTLAAGGTLKLVGNASQSVREVIGTLTVTGSGNVLRNESSGGQTSTLHIGNLSLGAGQLLVQGTNLGGPSGSLGRIFLNQFNAVAVTNGQILTNLTAEDLTNPGVIEQGIYDTTVGIRLLNPVTDFTNGVAIQNAAPTNLPTTANFRVNPGMANPVPVLDAANTINALRFAPNGNVDYTAGVNSVLTITSGSLFTEAGGAATITQGGAGTLTLSSGAAQMGIVTNSNLTIASTIGGTGGFSKTGAATLFLNGPISNTGPVGINGGTVVLGAGVNLTTSSLSGAGALDIGANNLSLTGASNANMTITGTGALSFAGTTTLGGNNAGFSGPVNGGATATVTLGNNNGFGTGQVTLGNLVSTSLITFNGGSGTVANNIAFPVFTGTSGITHNTALSNQSVTLSGLITGGSATQLLRLANGNGDDSCTTVLTNAGNSFVASSIQVWEGVLAFTSDAALGNANNGLSLNTTSTTRGGLRFDANNISLAATRGVSIVDSTNFIDTQANTGTIAGVISNTGTLAKTGSGKLIFSNTLNTHTGVVNVNAGTLQVDGNIALSAANPVNVNAGGTLSGVGTILRTVNVAAGGILSPGASPGILDVNGVALVANSTLFIEIDGNIAGDGANRHDQLNVTGSVALGGSTLDLDSLVNYAPAITDLLFIIANDGGDAVGGTFAGLAEGAVVTWDTYWSANISYLGDTAGGAIGTGNDVVLYNVVPAPGAGVLLGLAGVFASRRRRH